VDHLHIFASHHIQNYALLETHENADNKLEYRTVNQTGWEEDNF